MILKSYRRREGGLFVSHWSASILVVSDIHLSHIGDKRAQALLHILREIPRAKVEYLVLLGDIFDFCLGSHRYFQGKFQAIGEALEAVAASGCRVIFLEGNHEFKLASLPWQGVTFVPEGTIHLQTQSGQRIQCAHGDMIYSHRPYKIFRSIVKSWLVTSIARLLPGPIMDKLATTSSEVSRAQDQYRSIKHEPIVAAVDGWLEQGKAEFGLFGHFHVPYAEGRRDQSPGGLLSVESWDRPNVLALKDGRFYRAYLEENWQWQLAASLIRPLQSQTSG